jgi:translation initiation factor IF-2
LSKNSDSNRFLHSGSTFNLYSSSKYLVFRRLRSLKTIRFSFSNVYSNEDTLVLTNPLLVFELEDKLHPLIASSLHSEHHPVLISLTTKPSLKTDKKVKKNEKDDDRETERVNLRLKVKKKTRTKLNFDEDYDSISDLLDNNEVIEDSSLLPLARPPKPISTEIPTTGFAIKPKQPELLNKKKKKSGSLISRKELELLNTKPEKVEVTKALSVQALADIFAISTTEIIRSLFLKSIPVTLNQLVDLTTIQTLGQEFNIEVIIKSSEVFSDTRRLDLSNSEGITLCSRPPIVTIMGHVDHGKTTLLDKIRKTQVAKKEAGGITQRIGAYEVDIEYKEEIRKLIFLDTPGHEAFSGMRSRGVAITDIVILVVAADDGVKPQTVEAIKYVQAAQVPLIVAINKIDKDDANEEIIKEELTKYNIVSESWGGDTLMVPISAIQGTNVENLLEMTLLLSDVLNLKANPSAPAEGTVIESNLDRTKGAVATLIIQNGTLHVGDIVTFGSMVAKVRGMVNSLGEVITEASPSSPVLIWGLSKVPSIGDRFVSFADEKGARLFIESQVPEPMVKFGSTYHMSDSYSISELENKEKINLIIKTDTQGSAEAINVALSKLDNTKVYVRVLYSCAGEITEKDIDFASTSNATLLSFNTTLASGAKKAAKMADLIIREFDVIYDLFDYVESLIENLVGPQYQETFTGSAVVKTVFPLAKSFVAGSGVSEGKLLKDSFIHVLRNDEIVYKGQISSLKQMKSDVSEVSQGSECGIFTDGFDSWKQGDIINAFELSVKKKKSL